MRLICTFLILLISTSSIQSQKITGIWRGYFVQKAFNEFTGRFMEDKYKYEIQINQLPNNGIEGVTYSYKNITFYGKASFKGIYTKGTGNVLVKELKMLELKISNGSEPCLMTCYLDYKKEGKLESLTGTYTSLNDKKKTDCGEGTLYLEKVPESDFEKEDFLTPKKKIDSSNILLKSKSNNADLKVANIKKIQSALGITADGIAGPQTIAALKRKVPTVQQPNFENTVEVNAMVEKIKKGATVITKPAIKKTELPVAKTPTTKPTLKPGAEEFVIKKGVIKNDNTTAKKRDDSLGMIETKPAETPAAPVFTPTPEILLQRENKLVQTIIVNVNDVQVDFYDNGQIDNDTITVYLNNNKVISSQPLSYKPITLNLHLDAKHLTDELITVADNLGDVPPNTALMVITAGNKRYEVTIASDEKTNGKVIIEYRATGAKVQH